jgi:hypothetical protein
MQYDYVTLLVEFFTAIDTNFTAMCPSTGRAEDLFMDLDRCVLRHFKGNSIDECQHAFLSACFALCHSSLSVMAGYHAPYCHVQFLGNMIAAP